MEADFAIQYILIYISLDQLPQIALTFWDIQSICILSLENKQACKNNDSKSNT